MWAMDTRRNSSSQLRIRLLKAADQLRAVVVLVDRQAGFGAEARGGISRCAGQPALEIALQFGEHHAASVMRSMPAVLALLAARELAPMPRAVDSSCSSSCSGGMLSSRSIIVATGPSSETAFAYSRQTASLTGLSCVSISRSRPWL